MKTLIISAVAALLIVCSGLASAQVVSPTFAQSGAGAVLRPVASKARDVISVLDHGIVPDSSSAAAANATALRKLVSSAANGGNPNFQFNGTVVFPLGKTYYIGDIIPFRDGIHLDLSGSTLHFSKTADASDNAAGFLYARRDFSAANGSIEVDYNGAGVRNRGAVFKFNARYGDSDQAPGNYFLNNFEEDQAPGGTPMPVMPGNIELRNLRITSNNPDAAMIQMVGGLKGVTMDNVYLDGKNLAYKGIDYEFGGATDEVLNQNEKSSHGNNFSFRNIEAKNLVSAGAGTAISIRGAYNVTVDNLYAADVKSVLSFSPGEAENYNPGSLDVAGVKRNNYFRNIVGQGITATGIVISGNSEWTGFLSPLATQTQTDAEGKTTGLIDAVVENFTLRGAPTTSAGVAIDANKVILRSGRIEGFGSGIFDTGTRNLMVDAVDIFDCTVSGIRVTVGSIYPSGWTDRRLTVRNSAIAGNGTSGAGWGILFEAGQSNAIIENNNFGYNDRATGRITVTGGTAGAGINKLSSLKVGGVEILNGPVDWVTSNTATAAAIGASINAKTSAPDYSATSFGATVLIRALLGTGTRPNGFVVLPTVAGNMTVGSVKNMSGGLMELNQINSVFVSTGISNVTVRNNMSAVAAGGVSYKNREATMAAGNYLEKNIGDTSFSGGWNADSSAVTGTLTGRTTSRANMK